MQLLTTCLSWLDFLLLISTCLGQDVFLTKASAGRTAEPSRWVYGKHGDGCELSERPCNAVAQCALGSPGCLAAEPEPINVAVENAPAEARLAEAPGAHLIIVPGYTPNDAEHPWRLHPHELKRVELAVKAMADLNASAILVSGGNVHPHRTRFCEAFEMKRALVDEFGVPANRVVLDPYARHTTTNLRNAGRFMLEFNISKATIVSTAEQSAYVGWQWISTFRSRCRRELGYVVGELKAIGIDRTEFTPDPAVWTRGTDARDP